MPTYEYICKECENQWEAEQKISDEPIKECPKCKKETAKRCISNTNFHLKGGGWFKDGY